MPQHVYYPQADRGFIREAELIDDVFTMNACGQFGFELHVVEKKLSSYAHSIKFTRDRRAYGMLYQGCLKATWILAGFIKETSDPTTTMRITMRTTTIINPPCRQAPLHAAGYSLLELLVVLSIMATLMTIGSYGIKNFSKASGVSAAIPIAQGVFSQARALAIEKGTNTRVMMHADTRTDNLNRERNLRYMVVQYEDTDGNWVTATKGVKLPEGVFYSLVLSNRSTAPNPTQSSGALPGGAVQNCRTYEFNAQGIITSPPPTNGNDYGNDVPRFVIRAGSLPPGSTEPIPASGAGERNVGGFVIWKNGRTAVFRHPDQVFF